MQSPILDDFSDASSIRKLKYFRLWFKRVNIMMLITTIWYVIIFLPGSADSLADSSLLFGIYFFGLILLMTITLISAIITMIIWVSALRLKIISRKESFFKISVLIGYILLLLIFLLMFAYVVSAL